MSKGLVKLSVDVMGGDRGLATTLPACIQALKKQRNLHLTLVGDQSKLDKYQEQIAPYADRLAIVHSTQEVSMDESPISALRNKKQSSMRVAIDLVKAEQVQGIVSAGNTGALMATAHYVLKTIPGIERSAIIAKLPCERGFCRMLDLGANVDSAEAHLMQFAVMGSIISQFVDKAPSPRVGLLNVGIESTKGNAQVKAAHQLLAQQHAINYLGYVEGDDIFNGNVDVVVCDGFVGNTILKSSEGLAALVKTLLKSSFNRNLSTKIIGLLARPVLKHFSETINPARYNGASFIGLRHPVVKSHGGATIEAYTNAIFEAVAEVELKVPQLIEQRVKDFLE